MTDRPDRDRSGDEISFSDAMSGVTPHQHDRADLSTSLSRDINQAARRASATEEQERVIDNLSSEAVDIVESNEELVFAGPGVQFRVLKRLKQGHIPWEAGIDLHGYTVDQAREALSSFLRASQHEQFRCVKIVHGKAYSQAGKEPLLKSYVNEWLRRFPHVLAFCSALPREGGTGALYVLLKRKPR